MKNHRLMPGIIRLFVLAITFSPSLVCAQSSETPLSSLLTASNEHFSPSLRATKVDGKRFNPRGKNKSNSKKPQKKQSPFPGLWITLLSQKKNTCSGNLPATLKVGLKISSKLVGTDSFDNSPFFTGRILAANKIGFSRSRTSNGCKQTQTYVLGNVSGKKGATVLQSDTQCGTLSCQTIYAGVSNKQ